VPNLLLAPLALATGRLRPMSSIFSYTPADTRWWNGRVHNAGTERTELDDGRNPIVYPQP
jgi:hypothetical protein